MAKRDVSNIQRRIKKVKKLKKRTAEMRDEMTQWLNFAENHYQAIVETREAVLPLILASQSLDAQVNDLISAWLAQNDGD